jgi:hypothetical protein
MMLHCRLVFTDPICCHVFVAGCLWVIQPLTFGSTLRIEAFVDGILEEITSSSLASHFFFR